MYKEKIGIVGGFGAYATLNFYKRILECFASESERNYPHIIMDNNFTMPSRTRALLYHENYDEVVREITESVERLLDQQVDRIVLVCGTAHYFLDDIYRTIPQAKDKIVDIIEVLGAELMAQNEEQALIIAAEGALLKGLYPKRLEKYGISCIIPSEEYYEKIRYFIECVKQNKLTENTADAFYDFLQQFTSYNVVLGCTEFPILVKYIQEQPVIRYAEWESFQFFDPMELTIQYLKRTLV
ncbi:MAG: amino acid racemase [Ruminococcus sp.]|nr:amino acid racemase [Ruminococcus sp.]